MLYLVAKTMVTIKTRVIRVEAAKTPREAPVTSWARFTRSSIHASICRARDSSDVDPPPPPPAPPSAPLPAPPPIPAPLPPPEFPGASLWFGPSLFPWFSLVSIPPFPYFFISLFLFLRLHSLLRTKNKSVTFQLARPLCCPCRRSSSFNNLSSSAL